MTYRKISADGYTRDQLHFKRGHTGELERTTASKPLWPFAVGAGFALLIGCQMIVKANDSGIAAIGAGLALGGMGIVWFIFDQMGHRDGGLS